MMETRFVLRSTAEQLLLASGFGGTVFVLTFYIRTNYAWL